MAPPIKQRSQCLRSLKEMCRSRSGKGTPPRRRAPPTSTESSHTRTGKWVRHLESPCPSLSVEDAAAFEDIFASETTPSSIYGKEIVAEHQPVKKTNAPPRDDASRLSFAKVTPSDAEVPKRIDANGLKPKNLLPGQGVRKNLFPHEPTLTGGVDTRAGEVEDEEDAWSIDSLEKLTIESWKCPGTNDESDGVIITNVASLPCFRDNNSLAINEKSISRELCSNNLNSILLSRKHPEADKKPDGGVIAPEASNDCSLALNRNNPYYTDNVKSILKKTCLDDQGSHSLSCKHSGTEKNLDCDAIALAVSKSFSFTLVSNSKTFKAGNILSSFEESCSQSVSLPRGYPKPDKKSDCDAIAPPAFEKCFVSHDANNNTSHAVTSKSIKEPCLEYISLPREHPQLKKSDCDAIAPPAFEKCFVSQDPNNETSHAVTKKSIHKEPCSESISAPCVHPETDKNSDCDAIAPPAFEKCFVSHDANNNTSHAVTSKSIKEPCLEYISLPREHPQLKKSDCDAIAPPAFEKCFVSQDPNNETSHAVTKKSIHKEPCSDSISAPCVHPETDKNSDCDAIAPPAFEKCFVSQDPNNKTSHAVTKKSIHKEPCSKSISVPRVHPETDKNSDCDAIAPPAFEKCFVSQDPNNKTSHAVTKKSIHKEPCSESISVPRVHPETDKNSDCDAIAPPAFEKCFVSQDPNNKTSHAVTKKFIHKEPCSESISVPRVHPETDKNSDCDLIAPSPLNCDLSIGKQDEGFKLLETKLNAINVTSISTESSLDNLKAIPSFLAHSETEKRSDEKLIASQNGMSNSVSCVSLEESIAESNADNNQSIPQCVLLAGDPLLNGNVELEITSAEVEVIEVEEQAVHFNYLSENSIQDHAVDEDHTGDPFCSPSVSDANENTTVHKRRRKRKFNAETETTPVKKRKQNPYRWRVTVAKEAYNSGIAHVSMRGKNVEARSLGPGCLPSCKKNCHAKISQEKRLRIFQSFWALKDHTRQWDFIVRNVDQVAIKKRRNPFEDNEDAYRKHSYQYKLYDPDQSSQKIICCQTMFLDTLSVSKTYVQTAFLKADKSEGKISPIKMGKHPKSRPLSNVLTTSVIEHIKSFPAVESHYCRERTKRKYLSEHLTVAKMHRLYLIQRSGESHNASLRQYRDIFNTKFNISFFKPKKDQCPDCLAWNNMSEQEKSAEGASTRYKKHIEDKKAVKKLKEDDLTTSTEKNTAAGSTIVRVITFDLEKVLYCPKGENSDFFYKRKLSCFNFTIFDCTVKEAVCYVWDQTTAGRGSNEMSSCLFDFIETRAEEGVKEFHFWSDNCSAQNKNQYLFSMYNLACLKFGVKIIHRWLVKGHTHMECDSVHAMIEKRTKNTEIFTPSQWYGFIRTAKVNPPFYKVKELDSKSVLEFLPLGKMHLWSKLPILSMKELLLDSNNPGVATFKREYGGNSESFTVLPKTVGRPINWANFKLQPAYSGVLPLKPNLHADLMWYVQKGHIPTAYHHFYNSLPNSVVEVPETEGEAQVSRGAARQKKLRKPSARPANGKRTAVKQAMAAKQSKDRKKNPEPDSSSSEGEESTYSFEESEDD